MSKSKELKPLSLTPHPIWQSVVNADSFEGFKTHILPELFLKKEVPEDVVHNVEVIRKLLLHSYFEYDFIDIALTQSVFALEQALKIRYRELNSKSYKGNFKKLIEWFYERGYFETYNSGIAHQLRYIRNKKVHDEKNMLGGTIFLLKVKTPVMLINDIFEDKDLRKERKVIVEELQKRLNELFKKGSILKVNDSSYIIDKISVVFVNNKEADHVLSLIAWPIYDPSIYLNEEHHYSTRPFFEFRLHNWVFEKDGFLAYNENNEKIILHPILKAENEIKYQTWLAECEKAKDMSRFNELGANRKANDVFLKELDLLHKQG